MATYRDGELDAGEVMMKFISYMLVFVLVWSLGGTTFISLFPETHPSWIMVFGFFLGTVSGRIASDAVQALLLPSKDKKRVVRTGRLFELERKNTKTEKD